MTNTSRRPVDEYIQAFMPEYSERPFLHYYTINPDKSVAKRLFSRGEFFTISAKAVSVLKKAGCGKGKFFLNCFGKNNYADLAFRLAATMTGAIPVTVNWQADTLECLIYKIKLTSPTLILCDNAYNLQILSDISKNFPAIIIYNVSELERESTIAERDFISDFDPEDCRMVIFTSGTTSYPKGVKLPYRSYKTNGLTFEKLLCVSRGNKCALCLVNPLHHTNSTAFSDWALRRPTTELHLFERYSSQYWKILTEITYSGYDRIIAPTVSRHFDFLENLEQEDCLPIQLATLNAAMGKIDFLIGSAPVGPSTVKILKKYTGKIPLIRFGSTETCLQVTGIPFDMSEEQQLAALEVGWEHCYNGENKSGYFIGRPTPPYTEVKIVKAIDCRHENYMVECKPGKPGYLITRGDNIMSEYLNDQESTETVFHDDWYLGLRDICFALPCKYDGILNYYWHSRDSFMLIKGGSNYAYDQINRELTAFTANFYALPKHSFEIAVVGMKIDSEHEDSCCVTIELKDNLALDKKEKIANSFIKEARRTVSKGAKPDYLRFGQILKNFKGAFMLKEIRETFENIKKNDIPTKKISKFLMSKRESKNGMHL